MENWRSLLDLDSHMSGRFRTRMARVLGRGCAGASPEAVSEARDRLVTDPRSAVRALVRVPDEASPTHRSVVEWLGPDALSTTLIPWLPEDLDTFLEAMPPLLRTRVPLHPARRATRVPTTPAGPLVAVCWPGDSIAARDANRLRMVEAIAVSPRLARDDVLPILAPDRQLIARMSSGPAWVLAPDYGSTVEDELRDNLMAPTDRAILVRTVAALRAAMLDDGVVWQGFAPRNMFRSPDGLVLIDFEACAEVADAPVSAAEYLAWHSVFFADCLTDPERHEVFSPHAMEPSLQPDLCLAADPFERALLGASEVSWQERAHFLSRSARLEGRHPRPSPDRDDGLLFAHELGHFWGDFVPVASEAKIFASLDPLTDVAELVGCLEVFEAAMEADIDALLLADALRDPAPACARTEAIAGALAAGEPGHLAAARREVNDWYRQLESDPGKLVDKVLAKLHESARLPATDLLIGDPGQRPAQTERLRSAVEVGLGFLHADRRDGRFLHHAEPQQLLKIVSEALPVAGTDFANVLDEVDDRLVRYSISQAHHGYLAFPDSGNAVASVAGSMLTRLLNQNLIAVDRSAPAATFATIQVIEWLRELVGYEVMPLTQFRGVKDVAGLWTTGGHMSNHIAMLTALGHRFPNARQSGVRGLTTQPTVIMAGAIAHYSHSDAAFHLGLGWDAVQAVAARPNFTTDPDAVDAVLSEPPEGTTPFMVVGVAGNCRTTGLDDLAAIAEVCRRHEVWFHADACHGGSLIFNEHEKRTCLGDLEQADSVSLDPHKGLFTPYPSSYVLFRDRGVLNQFSRHAAAVQDDDCWDLGLITPFFGSVGFEALPTWMLLKHVGVRGLGQLIETRHALIRHLQRRLDDCAWFVRLNDVDFYRVAWVYCPPAIRAACRATTDPHEQQRLRELVSTFTGRLNDLLYRAGEVCFDEHTLADLDDRVGLGTGGSYTIMASCPGNPLTTFGDIDTAVDELIRAAQSLVQPMTDALSRGESGDQQRRIAGPAGWADQ
jgi:glutamate/tyrosine decarboxylase-like PLP-dependent enzyme